MPEGDTVHKIAAAIRPRLVGRVVRQGKLRTKRQDPIAGERVAAVYVRGKHLFIEFDSGTVLRSHLGLFGAWHRYSQGEHWQKPERQASVALWTDHEVLVCFNAKEVELLRSAGIRQRNLLHRLGPDLLGPRVDLDEIAQRAREFLEPEVLLVDVLLDQRVACGIGNVYKSEVLFIEGLYPSASLTEVGDSALRRLYSTARCLLQRNLGGGRRITRFVEDGAGPLWVYGRSGKPCLRCRTEIRAERSGRDRRWTYWCASCQRP